MVAVEPDLLCKLYIICCDDPSLPIGPQVFGKIKAETACIPERSAFLIVITCAMGLAGVLNYSNAMSLCAIVNGRHISALAIHMDWYDRLCLLCNPFFYRLRRDSIRQRVDVDKYRTGAYTTNSLCSGKECMRRCDNLVAFPYPARQKRKLYRFCP